MRMCSFSDIVNVGVLFIVGEVQIEESDDGKLLGITFDKELTFLKNKLGDRYSDIRVIIKL